MNTGFTFHKIDNSWLLLSLGICSYFILMVTFISTAYLDFGDGNYLYISQRMLQGIIIYKEILSPQPPLHLFLGVLLLKLGAWIGNPLFIIRLYTIFLRISHALLIYVVCQKIFASDDNKKHIGSLAGILYLFLPIGFWWSRGFQTEPEEIALMLATLLFFLRFDVKGMVLASVLSAFGILTNMTFAPYFCLNLFYVFIRSWISQKKVPNEQSKKITFQSRIKSFRLVFAYLFPAISILGLVSIVMTLYTDGQFLQNVIFDQVGTYPKENTLPYMLGKMKWIIGIILTLEGPLIVSALVGLFFYLRKANDNQQHFILRPSSYIFIYSLASLGSFIFATKGGTVDYIFTLGEPIVAIFSAFTIILIIDTLTIWIKPLYSWSVGIILIFLLSSPGIKQDICTLQGTNYELDEKTVDKVVTAIQEYTLPEELIFAPPYFAFLAERKIVGEFSEQFVWFMKYYNYIRYREGNPQTIQWIAAMAREFENKQVKFVMLNIDPTRGQQTGKIYPIRKAVDDHYQPIGEIRMRNETLTIFLPKE
ncbi:MAG: glycosyltransferase family 39 protein [bacterium]|nr:glycosyltransferase family 39 protein [bacterium]